MLLEPSHGLCRLVTSYGGNLSKHMLSWALTKILIQWKFLSSMMQFSRTGAEPRNKASQKNAVWQAQAREEI